MIKVIWSILLCSTPIVSATIAAPAWSQTPTSPEKPPLSVCLQANDPPLSHRGDDAQAGFGVLLSRSIAHHLGRDLHIQWFVSRDDPDDNLIKDANVLLSDGRCQLMAEYPLLASTIAPPIAPTAKLPPFDGAKPEDHNRWVKMNPLAATKPYRLDAITVVLSARQASRNVQHLADLDGLKIGVQTATLSDAIAMRYENSRLIEHVVHMPDTRDVFQALQAGKVDAALVDLRAFDAWRDAHGSAGLAPSGYIHPVAFNMAFVALASDRTLIDQVNAILADLQAKNEITEMATTAGLTYIPPHTPDVGPNVNAAALQGD